jgi:uncharacterized protein
MTQSDSHLSSKPHSNERIDVIDRIRGTALFGILIFNIQTYALFAFLRPDQVYSMGFDTIESYAPVQFFVQLLVKGQFYTIYSFLFGLGFFMLYHRASAKGLDAKRIFKRRLWTLLLFGLIHGLVFWFGDILHKYAILGFTLLYFNKKSIATLLKWILGFLGVAMLMQVVKFVLTDANNTPDPEMDKVILEVVDTWQNGSFIEVLNMQKLGVAMLWLTSLMSGFANMIHFEIMFILGLIAGKLNLFQRVGEIVQHWKKPALYALPLVIGVKAFAVGHQLLWLDHGPSYFSLLRSLAEFIATPLLTLIYLLALSHLFNRNNTMLFKWIGNAGRLGLSNYILQTLLCMLLFYGYAGGLAGKLNLWQTLIVTLAIYSFQLLISSLWLRFFTTGPLEWLWKRMSYGKSG